MTWNWQKNDWPNFSWDAPRFARAEEIFLLRAGVLLGSGLHLNSDEKLHVLIEEMSDEALTTSEIEGEFLDRASVQSSIQRQLGLKPSHTRVGPAEHGIAELMVDLYRTVSAPLSSEVLCGWHAMVMAGRKNIRVGEYRVSPEPMLVVSGPTYKPKVHFEAVPSARVPSEMAAFIDWFNRTGPRGSRPMPALTRAGIAHIYFVSIHPFEDGNGRIGRAIAEKALAQSFNQNVLIALAASILAHHSAYYNALEAANKKNEITTWLTWFASTAIEAQRRSMDRVEFVIDKTRFLDTLRPSLNPRQLKVLLRMLEEGPEGFRGGLSAANYATITGAPPSTVTRDLVGLLDLGALTRSGERKYARYELAIPIRPLPHVSINDEGELLERT